MRFEKKVKLAPRFIGPFPITNKIVNVAYQLELPQQLSMVHNVFHVSMLGTHLRDEERSQQEDLTELVVKPDAAFENNPIRIVERQVIKLRSRALPFVKVQWNPQNEREATWESEDVIHRSHPHLFNNEEKGKLSDDLALHRSYIQCNKILIMKRVLIRYTRFGPLDVVSPAI
ncbi:uncharacterized protein LOC113274498 [Papaver somniferum]|uniref:uncharacterized protein LOC113274498 n=1 Tax=Papaver somniferum TaxID=3469 RepID=UPI000E6F61D5|nr:uncharacterized protein LOC113274498 [Papaver somniferum]